jgi:hypothetical protein
MPTCNRLDLQTLGSQPIISAQNSPRSLVYKDVDIKDGAMEIPDLKLGSDSRVDTFLLKTPLSSLETI